MCIYLRNLLVMHVIVVNRETRNTLKFYVFILPHHLPNKACKDIALGHALFQSYVGLTTIKTFPNPNTAINLQASGPLLLFAESNRCLRRKFTNWFLRKVTLLCTMIECLILSGLAREPVKGLLVDGS